ncbi:sensor histidine kinase [Streptomyces sp. NBC_01408]|uniref:sensor histidine kinase n=1 Tax=Streptomyces sp. NBC_01408 TaxID=2903855 RepID=UPI00224D5360|nr:histidine kinase [Streptomyces sp. NBC_01408]MCX4696672.1 histidine kinase [Streptomyces sp. NBC_01408]
MRSVIMKFRVPAPVLSAGLLLGAVVAAGTGVATLWWGVPAAVCAFLAGGRPGRNRSAAAALAAVLVAAVAAVLLVPTWLGWASRFAGLLLVAAMLPWFAGRFLRQYRELVRAGWERAGRLEREQRLVAEQARLRERTRIAQDMHDLLGHDLSLIALSAGALKLAPGLPEEHRAAAQDIRARAGAAVDRLGEVIGVLREPVDPADPAGPGAGFAELAGLVDRAAAAGLDVRLREEGGAAAGGAAPDVTPRAVERAVYRVVQEALTNAAKHAPGRRTTVVLRHGEERTEVSVTDEPIPGNASVPVPAPVPVPASVPASVAASAVPSQADRLKAAPPLPPAPGPRAPVPPAPPEGHGFGLIGLDERVRLAGGAFAAGPEGGGFAVRATLPHRAGAASPQPAGPDDAGGTLPAEHRRARRRLGRTATAAVLVPLCTAALLIGGIRLWDTVTARQSVLDPQDYAGLRVGQPRADVAPYLPERQTTRRPVAPTPVPPDAACEFYVQTADPFDDRSGDVYRLCFRAGRLVSTDNFTGKDVR